MSQIELANDCFRFYEALNSLAKDAKCIRTLADCRGKMGWPKRGVYIFLGTEIEIHGKSFSRVTRIGTHAVSVGSKTTLWNRLAQHRGNISDGAGNHRGSIFRLLVGQALINRDSWNFDSWGIGNNAPPDVRECEKPLEKLVSQEIGKMPFLFVEIDDEPSPTSLRSRIERNSIALISRYHKLVGWGDEEWLGKYSNRERVRNSGLWNNNYVGDEYDSSFLEDFETMIGKM